MTQDGEGEWEVQIHQPPDSRMASNAVKLLHTERVHIPEQVPFKLNL